MTVFRVVKITILYSEVKAMILYGAAGVALFLAALLLIKIFYAAVMVMIG